MIILVSNFLSKLGDALASPKPTLAWVMSLVGAPVFDLGLLVPVRESGSLIPNSSSVTRFAILSIRKWVCVCGCVIQGCAIVALGAVVIHLAGDVAGFAILLSVVVSGVARGFCSVAAKDVLGRYQRSGVVS